MRFPVLLFALMILPATACAQSADQPEALSVQDQSAAFKAAGFTLSNGQWQACGDPGTASYTPGMIEQVTDLNGDSLPEAVITEGSTFCFGMTGTGYALVGKQTNGDWQLIGNGPGILRFLDSKGRNNWPDVEVGGPGFCFPVMRWTGAAYAIHRHEYEGRQCNPH